MLAAGQQGTASRDTSGAAACVRACVRSGNFAWDRCVHRIGILRQMCFDGWQQAEQLPPTDVWSLLQPHKHVARLNRREVRPGEILWLQESDDCCVLGRASRACLL
jgi:hypothetical protein